MKKLLRLFAAFLLLIAAIPAQASFTVNNSVGAGGGCNLTGRDNLCCSGSHDCRHRDIQSFHQRRNTDLSH